MVQLLREVTGSSPYIEVLARHGMVRLMARSGGVSREIGRAYAPDSAIPVKFEMASAVVDPRGPYLWAARYAGISYWYLKGRLYSTNQDRLSAEDVVALVHESENQLRLRLQKAHALEAMATQLTEASSRREPIPRDVKITVWQRDGGHCVQCGSNEDLEFDHVIPLKLGGANTVRNLQLLCEPCNRRKGATLG